MLGEMSRRRDERAGGGGGSYISFPADLPYLLELPACLPHGRYGAGGPTLRRVQYRTVHARW